MNTKILIILLCFFTVSFAQAQAQDDDVIVINKKELRKSMRKPARNVMHDHVFKFAPLNMIVGEMTFGFEKVMNENSSMDFELGVTVSELGFGNNGNHTSYPYYYDPYYGPYYYSSRESGAGVVAAVGYRYYPLDDFRTLNKFYVSPILRYKLMTHTVSSNGLGIGNKMGTDNKLSFLFNFGYQLWVSNSFSLDFYTGLGLGYVSNESYMLSSIYDYNTNTYDYSWDKYSDYGVNYQFNMGLKVGIGGK